MLVCPSLLICAFMDVAHHLCFKKSLKGIEFTNSNTVLECKVLCINLFFKLYSKDREKEWKTEKEKEEE